MKRIAFIGWLLLVVLMLSASVYIDATQPHPNWTAIILSHVIGLVVAGGAPFIFYCLVTKVM